MIQGCFSNPASPTRNKSNALTTSNSSSSMSKESLITCIYLTRLLDSPIYLTLTWSKTPNSHTLTLHAPECFSVTISLHQSAFSLFRTRASSKSIRLEQSPNHKNSTEGGKIKLYYDFTRAESTQPHSAEPGSRFYLALVRDGRVEFFIGDMAAELTRRLGVSRLGDSVGPSLLSRREHVFGRKSYSTRARFLGSDRVIEIECCGGAMKVKFDGETKLHVKRLAWKFRGNEKIFINGIGVEFYWDVFNWVSNNGGKVSYGQQNGGNGVFVFQVGERGVCPEIVGPEKKLLRKNSPATMPNLALSPAGSCSSVWQWAEESSDCGRSSSGSSSTTTRSSGSFNSGGGGGNGFSLVLYAWRRD